MKYEINDIEKGYYADGEDAYDMKCVFHENVGINKVAAETTKITAMSGVTRDPAKIKAMVEEAEREEKEKKGEGETGGKSAAEKVLEAAEKMGKISVK